MRMNKMYSTGIVHNQFRNGISRDCRTSLSLARSGLVGKNKMMEELKMVFNFSVASLM
jgi:hypothetical protein